MIVTRVAAFSDGDIGGNPAGVVLLESAGLAHEMANLAAEIGYSETAFAYPLETSKTSWRVRYFSPESEVPFCGHATIALGSVLADNFGAGRYQLTLNNSDISVATQRTEQGAIATLSSPPTNSRNLTIEELTDALDLFGLDDDDFDQRLPPARIHGGADHVLLVLKDRETLGSMQYDLDKGREIMNKHGLVTIMLTFIESDDVFSVRNAFASGGVLEDPATGAAAAAFAGYLRDRHWSSFENFTIKQGEDMGSPSVINVTATNEKGASVTVSGSTRAI